MNSHDKVICVKCKSGFSLDSGLCTSVGIEAMGVFSMSLVLVSMALGAG